MLLALSTHAYLERSHSWSASPHESVHNASKKTSRASGSGTPEKGKQGKPLICPCLQADDMPLPRDVEGNVLIPASFFGLNSDEVYKRDRAFGTYCAAHYEGLAPDCDPEKKHDKAKDHCGRRWCFVADDCACGEAAKKLNGKMKLKDAWHIPMSRFKVDYFNPQEGRETNIWYSYANCGEGTDWIDDHMSRHNRSFCGSASGHCEQEDEVCYRDAHGGARYAGAQAAAGSSAFPWISIGLGFGAFILMVLIGWLLDGLKGRQLPDAGQPDAGQPDAEGIRPS